MQEEDLWADQIDEATDKAEFEFGFGCDFDAKQNYGVQFTNEDSDTEVRYDCKELKTGGHL